MPEKTLKNQKPKSQIDLIIPIERPWENFDLGKVCGLDEVGRGPLAGPVCAGAVILNPLKPILGLADSKALKKSRRLELAEEIKEKALFWGLGWVSHEEIEKLNIHYASLEAMKRAFLALLAQAKDRGLDTDLQLELIVSDGKFVPDLKNLSHASLLSVVKGDALVPAISAASIIAKETRDAYMVDLAKTYAGYGFEKHMGYPTPEHWEALRRLGPCPHHRLSWVRKKVPSS